MGARHLLQLRRDEATGRTARGVAEVRDVRLHPAPGIGYHIKVGAHAGGGRTVDVAAEIIHERVHVHGRVERRHRPGIIGETRGKLADLRARQRRTLRIDLQPVHVHAILGLDALEVHVSERTHFVGDHAPERTHHRPVEHVKLVPIEAERRLRRPAPELLHRPRVHRAVRVAEHMVVAAVVLAVVHMVQLLHLDARYRAILLVGEAGELHPGDLLADAVDELLVVVPPPRRLVGILRAFRALAAWYDVRHEEVRQHGAVVAYLLHEVRDRVVVEPLVAPAARDALDVALAVQEREPVRMFVEKLLARRHRHRKRHAVPACAAHVVDLLANLRRIDSAVQEHLREPVFGIGVTVPPDGADRELARLEERLPFLLPRLHIEPRQLRQELPALARPIPARVKTLSKERIDGEKRAALRIAPKRHLARLRLD